MEREPLQHSSSEIDDLTKSIINNRRILSGIGIEHFNIKVKVNELSEISSAEEISDLKSKTNEILEIEPQISETFDIAQNILDVNFPELKELPKLRDIVLIDLNSGDFNLGPDEADGLYNMDGRIRINPKIFNFEEDINLLKESTDDLEIIDINSKFKAINVLLHEYLHYASSKPHIDDRLLLKHNSGFKIFSEAFPERSRNIFFNEVMTQTLHYSCFLSGENKDKFKLSIEQSLSKRKIQRFEAFVDLIGFEKLKTLYFNNDIEGLINCINNPSPNSSYQPDQNRASKIFEIFNELDGAVKNLKDVDEEFLAFKEKKVEELERILCLEE